MTEDTLNFSQAHFITSAPTIRAMPADEGIEIAFAGRSNAGKSSALNTLTRQKNLARTSKTPGRTQLINVFEVAPHKRLIDLPGYGFAKVPEQMKIQWQEALSEYLQHRESLRGLVVLMDIRHPLRDLDQYLIQWAVDCNIPVLALLTKADKLKQGARKSTLLKCREAALAFCGDVQIEVFSALKKTGLPVLEQTLNHWLSEANIPPTEQV
ncbi:ribosome biogenesis GTP-binding protein YihA/YsxC [Celerinatantimonas diazotrophica]|uniref:Probable GTP-binding protein EngB n=1 Tax=Celerinatantimonas diazotrophica TaxID=412034 RepID=A0A4R1KF61_9GAMM|nr:ribosome biogenesis GTP-binding protein YihA/YsxC [Celerinatantimonas diazotrophica]TCK63316.1 cell division checkpoint GTPase YihA [Celerinatantimonas diazotrophica]CAG9298460.1 putative GTP-binding protein EngB [Celerinatantimonas diazotrophica]